MKRENQEIQQQVGLPVGTRYNTNLDIFLMNENFQI